MLPSVEQRSLVSATTPAEQSSRDIYIDDTIADVQHSPADGTKEQPYPSLFAAFVAVSPDSEFPVNYYVRSYSTEDATTGWKVASKTAIKKATARHADYVRKVHIQQEEEAARQRSLAEARTVVVTQDPNLPPALKIKISAPLPESIALGDDTVQGTRVSVVGRVENVRASKTRTFVYLTDTRGVLLCIFEGALNVTISVLCQKQASLQVLGRLKKVPPTNRAPGDRELHADYYRFIGEAPGGSKSFSNVVPADANQAVLSDVRHLVLRRSEESMVLRVRATALGAFRQFYKEQLMREATAPSFVQTQVEGGGSLFDLSYYGKRAYLTQTSQLYLETLLPVLGDCYTIQSSFRAENSHTRRHLSEYTHIEGELDFIVFEDLLQHIENLICRVTEIVLDNPETASYVKALNPGLKVPCRPFKRMRYTEAIKWLNEHKILTDEGKEHTFGTDIAEAAERLMTDQIGEPIMLTHFPVPLKAFYMKKDAEDPLVTESVDCLVPGVGEVVGAGMRIDDFDELTKVMQENKWDLKSYQFYSDQRRYGTSPHGGYGMGIERYLAWILGRHTVRECVAFPRYPGKCTP